MLFSISKGGSKMEMQKYFVLLGLFALIAVQGGVKGPKSSIHHHPLQATNRTAAAISAPSVLTLSIQILLLLAFFWQLVKNENGALLPLVVCLVSRSYQPRLSKWRHDGWKDREGQPCYNSILVDLTPLIEMQTMIIVLQEDDPLFSTQQCQA